LKLLKLISRICSFTLAQPVSAQRRPEPARSPSGPVPRPWPVSMADTARAPPPISWRACLGDPASRAL
jgi:hypothetical protein